MFLMNLNAVPPGHSLFTLYVGQKDKAEEISADEVDVIMPHSSWRNEHLTSEVIESSREGLVRLYGADVVVYGVVNQSTGFIVYDSRLKGFVPLPVTLTDRLAAVERPYDTLISLCEDEADGMGTGEYRDWLLEG